MPPLRLALAQIVLGPVNFAFVAACLHQMLAAVEDVAYPTVATVYVVANVAAILSHVPGGLGVIESVVLFLLAEGQLVGAVLMFRVIYFLVPLCLGGSAFALSEVLLRHRRVMRRRGMRRAQG